MYDCVIIGGGIAGLYTAYNLLNKNPSISLLLLEKNDYLGGRIYTVHKKGLTFEAGAGRFNDEHVILTRLIKNLGLQDLQIPIKSDIQFIPSTKYPSEYIGKDPFDVMTPVLVRAKREKRSVLREQTFIEYASGILSNQDLQFLKDSLGYYQQLVDMNAYDALKLFDKGMHTSNQFYVLKGGLSQVIDKLYHHLSTKCKIAMSMEVTSINDHNGCFKIKTSKSEFIGKTCVVALPKPAIQKLPYFKSLRTKLDCVGIKTLCRIYAQYNKNAIWFKSIPKTTTNNHNRYIIPIDREKGLIMISYTDSKFAHYWKRQTNHSREQKLRENINKTFGFEISKPIYMKTCYWETGTSFWKPMCNSNLLSRQIMRPFQEKNIYICGESFSMCQGWMEGALETSEEVVDKVLDSLKK